MVKTFIACFDWRRFPRTLTSVRKMKTPIQTMAKTSMTGLTDEKAAVAAGVAQAMRVWKFGIVLQAVPDPPRVYTSWLTMLQFPPSKESASCNPVSSAFRGGTCYLTGRQPLAIDAG